MASNVLTAEPILSETAPRRGAVFLPREHGSWSLALEPLALGLLVVPSAAGAALAAAALAGFFARRPLKAAACRPLSRSARICGSPETSRPVHGRRWSSAPARSRP